MDDNIASLATRLDIIASSADTFFILIGAS